MNIREQMVGASVVAQIRCNEILYCLMTLGRDDHPRWKVEHRLGEAREAAEAVLAAIHKAERAILSTGELTDA